MEFWHHYNVHLIWPDKHIEKLCASALSKEDVYFDTSVTRAIAAGAYPYKVIGPLGTHKRTDKQKMATHYRSCIGTACMLEKNLTLAINAVNPIDYNNRDKLDKVRNARSLALKQVYKVKRDIADMFKLMGLKIKHG